MTAANRHPQRGWSAILSAVITIAVLPTAGSSAEPPASGHAALGRDTVTVLANVNVVHMTGEGDPIWRNRSILIRDGRIETIAAASELLVPEGALRIDGDGTAFVTPGLTDAHVHLRGDAEQWLAMFLANGVTTVFNLWGDESHLEMRESIRAGTLFGPSIYTSGPFVNEPRIKTPEDAEKAVRDHVSAGYDFLKIHGDLQAETFEHLVRTASTAGMTVIGHAPRNLPFEAVLDLEMPMVAHAEEFIYTRFQNLDASDIPSIAERMSNAGIWLTPTLSTFETIVRIWGDSSAMRPILTQPEGRYLSPQTRTYWTDGNSYTPRDAGVRPRLRSMYEFQLPLVKAMHEAGVRLLTGTDAPLPGMYPGWSTHDEIEHLVSAGLDPIDALAAATRNPGEFIATHVSADDAFGTVTEGSRADLLLVAENPLEDLGVLRRPIGVVLRGQWLDRGRLQSALDAIAELSAR